jgi:hypothetical protein
VPKRHYQVSTYQAQNSIGYLVKRAHSLMLDLLLALADFTSADVQDFRRLLIKVNTTLHSAVEPRRMTASERALT